MQKAQVDQMTVQEAVDYSMARLVEQGGQCMDRNQRFCMYSDGRGNHCSIGWILDSDDPRIAPGGYTADGYAATIDAMALEYPDLVPELIRNNMNVFRYVQRLHDAKFRHDRRHIMEYLVSEYGLIPNADWHTWVDMGEEA